MADVFQADPKCQAQQMTPRWAAAGAGRIICFGNRVTLFTSQRAQFLFSRVACAKQTASDGGWKVRKWRCQRVRGLAAAQTRQHNKVPCAVAGARPCDTFSLKPC